MLVNNVICQPFLAGWAHKIKEYMQVTTDVYGETAIPIGSGFSGKRF